MRWMGAELTINGVVGIVRPYIRVHDTINNESSETGRREKFDHVLTYYCPI
jgi:hypothetical protein